MREELIKFIKFNAVGLLNTLIDLGVYTLLEAVGLYYVAAQVISYLCGMANSYVCNSLWTFREKNTSAGKVLAFVAVNLAALGVSIGVLAACRGLWGLEGLWAKVISLPFSLGVNFLGNRLFVFKGRSQENESDN